MIPPGEAERVPADALQPGDEYAKTRGGPTAEVVAINPGPTSSYITLRDPHNGRVFRIRPRHTTPVWRRIR